MFVIQKKLWLVLLATATSSNGSTPYLLPPEEGVVYVERRASSEEALPFGTILGHVAFRSNPVDQGIDSEEEDNMTEIEDYEEEDMPDLPYSDDSDHSRAA